MSNVSGRRPRPSKSGAEVEVVAESSSPEAAELPVTLAVISGILKLAPPTKAVRKGRPSVYNLDAMAEGDCFLFGEPSLVGVRRACAAANVKYSEKTDSTRPCRGKDVAVREYTRRYAVQKLDAGTLAQVGDEVLASIFPGATSRPTEVFGCWRTK